MYVEARRQEIIKLLSYETSMRVEEIISKFDETPATIRRDLTYLEKTGAIMRTHGAAKIVNPFPTRNMIASEEKIAIAKCAARMIEDGTNIILDSGTTTLSLANQLVTKKNVTVITNSLAIANALALSDVNTIITGGILNGKQQTIIGPDAEAYFDKVQASTLYLSATGIDPERGVTSITPFQVSIKQAMMRAAKRTVLLFDSHKVEALGLLIVTDFSGIDCAITSKPIQNKTFLDSLNKAGVEIIIAEK